MSRRPPTLASKQRGITFWQVLLLVVIAVSLAVCAKNQNIPYFQKPLSEIKNSISMPDMLRLNFQSKVTSEPSYPGAFDSYYTYKDYKPKTANNADDNVEWLLTSGQTTQVKPPPNDSAYELQYPRNLSRGFYTVQVLSGYNSKSAYELRNALRDEGYKAYIHQETTQSGILFKVRVGKYTNRANAFAMDTKLRLSYPENIKGSFVLMRQ